MIETAIEWFKLDQKDRIIGANINPRKTLSDKLIAVIPFCKSITVHGYCPMAKVWTRDILSVEVDFKPKILGLWRDNLILFNEKVSWKLFFFF